MQAKDRTVVAKRMKEHVSDPNSVPLLIFPEGTCVNNQYCVMFRKGAFDLGATVCPIAIKYNKIFVDAFWNSKRQSFSAHLGKLMRSWALVCDVYFLAPQARGEGGWQVAVLPFPNADRCWCLLRQTLRRTPTALHPHTMPSRHRPPPPPKRTNQPHPPTLPPQTKRADETSQQFAERVQAMIAKKAQLTVVPWDGYLKYYNLGEKVRRGCLLG